MFRLVFFVIVVFAGVMAFKADPPLCHPSLAPGNASCDFELGSYGGQSVYGNLSFSILEYNIDRGVDVPFESLVTLLSSGQYFPVADILVISEADRGCVRSNGCVLFTFTLLLCEHRASVICFIRSVRFR